MICPVCEGEIETCIRNRTCTAQDYARATDRLITQMMEMQFDE